MERTVMTIDPRIRRILVAVLAAPRIAPAQTYATDRGVWQPAGYVLASHSKTDPNGSEFTTLGVGPDIGYFVLPGLLVRGGGEVRYSTFSHGHSWVYGVGPGLAYYFRRGRHKLYPYISGTVSFDWYRTPNGNPNSSQQGRGTRWTASGGAVRLFTPNFGITGELYYTHFRQTFTFSNPLIADFTPTYADYGLRFGVAFFVY
jgi:hypothetical protein